MKKLLVLVGPTGVGKTELSLQLAEYFSSPILSVDSRQLYKGIEIGTAAPTKIQMERVPHYFVGTLSIDQYYSVSDYESHAIQKLAELYQSHDVIVATGGSMMYVDALCYGIDPIPTIAPEIREALYKQFEDEGLEPILAQLKMLDSVHYNEVDQKNYKRVIHAVEVCLTTGKPFSELRTNTKKERPFRIIRIGIEREREELYQRINQRVDQMMEDGLLAEARQHFDQRQLNALNTVGFKELFKHLEGEWELDLAIEKIKRNTRVYSRQQLRWFKKDETTHWINLSQTSESDALSEIVGLIEQ